MSNLNILKNKYFIDITNENINNNINNNINDTDNISYSFINLFKSIIQKKEDLLKRNKANNIIFVTF